MGIVKIKEKLKVFEQFVDKLVSEGFTGEINFNLVVNFNQGSVTKCKGKIEKSV